MAEPATTGEELLPSSAEPAAISSPESQPTVQTTTNTEDATDAGSQDVHAGAQSPNQHEHNEEYPDRDKESLHETRAQENPPSAAGEEFSEMKKRLAELEGRILGRKTLEDIQGEWQSSLDQYGSDGERRIWERRRGEIEQRLDETRNISQLSAQIFEGIQKGFDNTLNNEEAFEQKLITLRKRWERNMKDGYDRDGSYLRREIQPEDMESAEEWYGYMRNRLRKEQRKIQHDFEYMKEQLEEEFDWKRHRWMQTRRRLRRNRISVSPSPIRSASVHETETEAKHEVGDGVEIEIAPPVFHCQIYARPGETQMDWMGFQITAINKREEVDMAAIDVLMEEPYSDDIIRLWGRDHRFKPQGDKAPKKQALVPGQTPLPERIRINSTPLCKILEKIHGSELSSWRSQTPITILRPFKVLVYYEDKIREWYNKLAKKYHVQTETDAKGAAKDDEKLKGEGNDTADKDSSQETDSQTPPNDTASSGNENREKENKEDEEDDEVLTSTLALEHLLVLLDFIEKVHIRTKYLRSRECKSITYSDLWHLFKPGDFVIEREGEYGPRGRQVYRVINISSTPHKGSSTNALPIWLRALRDRSDKEESGDSVRIHCVCVDFDGEFIGPVTKEIKIMRFEGERLVKSLELQPLDIPNDKHLWKKLVDRGKKFLDVAKIKHMYYDGYTLQTSDELDSQVMVDFEEAFSVKGHDDWRPGVEAFALPEEPEETEHCEAHCCQNQSVHYDDYVAKRRNEEFMASLFPELNSGLQPSIAVAPRSLAELPENSVTNEELVIMSYRVFGFGMSSRTWEKLHLDYLGPVYDDEEVGKILNNQQAASRERKTAFDELVLPKGSQHKHIVKSLIAQHFNDKEKEQKTGESDQPDMVRGKGKGLILLLHGAPGVGKTTTAEGVAEFFRRPLFQITCGDLGSTAKDVEDVLVKYFALASKWGCILLLDEADVFLAQRDRLDYKRNGLVAVFLRILEYYAGVLFLTTNRLGDFDEAFASRIHISLHYPDLSQDSTRKVFQLNLNRIQKRKGDKVYIDLDEIFEFVDDYWHEHPDAHWNGRQIRNACQTALALAEFESLGNQHRSIENFDVTATLKRSHFETVADAYVEFTGYIDAIHGVNATQRAWEQHLRAGKRAKQRNSGPTNPLLRQKENSSSSTRPRTMGARHAESYQNQQHLAPPGPPNFQQQPMYQNQSQAVYTGRTRGGYDTGPDMSDPYDPSQPSLTRQARGPHVEAGILEPQLQAPGGLQGGNTAAMVNTQQYGTGVATDSGGMPISGAVGYRNMARGGAPMVNEGGITSYDQQQQMLSRGQVQVDYMNQTGASQQQMNQEWSHRRHQPPGNQQ